MAWSSHSQRFCSQKIVLNLKSYHESSAINMKYCKLYTLKPVSGGHCNRASLNNLGEAASVRNACDLCHAIGYVQSRRGVQSFKYYWLLYSRPASPSSPVSKLNPSWTPNPYLKPQCHPSLALRLCIGALPAWAAQPAAAAAASRLFLMTTNRPQWITRAAATGNATGPCTASRPSQFS